MAVNPENQIVAVNYTADDGNTYALGMKRSHAEAVAATAAGATTPAYPRGWKPRHIGGVGSDGIQRSKLVIPSFADALFTENGGTFTIAGVGVFAKTGSTGEKRPHKYTTL